MARILEPGGELPRQESDGDFHLITVRLVAFIVLIRPELLAVINDLDLVFEFSG